ncbi:hypothetical protein KEJ13_09605 [Candidatus Bathyarchaeota archaeon]|nr:hypothetical protein [Candidatus Bathyarchaeota archaeon]
MNEIQEFLRRNDVQKILRLIRDGKIDLIEPSIEINEIKYPKLEEIGIPKEEHEDILRFLSELGILTSEIRDTIITCPTCGSNRLQIHLRCPSCNSIALKRGVMIEHLSCGHLDLEEVFKSGEQLICPKCGRALKVIGVDYRKPGTLYRCMSCGDIFQTPTTAYTCNMGDIFSEGEAKVYLVKAYKPKMAALPILERFLIDLREILKDLPGWRIETPANFKDPFGNEHELAFAAWILNEGQEEGPPYVIGILEASERELDSTAVLAFRGRALEIPAKEKILIAMPGLGEKAHLLADNYRITVIEARDSTELEERLKKRLLSITKERENLKLEAHILEEILKEIDEIGEIEKEKGENFILKNKKGEDLSDGLSKILLKLATRKGKT